MPIRKESSCLRGGLGRSRGRVSKHGMGIPSQELSQDPVPLGLWVVDAEQHFVGAPPEPELATSIVRLARRAAAAGSVQTEEVQLSAGENGKARAVRLLARPASGGAVAVASLALDGLREAENTQARFAFVMQATRDAVWDWDAATGQTWWNRQQCLMLGYDPESTPPSWDAWERRIHPDDRERVMRNFRQVLASEATVWQGEYRFLRGDAGDVGVAMDRAYLLRDARGELLRVVGVMTDITSERAATAALRKSEERFREMTSAIEHLFWLSNPDGTEALYVSPAYEKIWGRSVETVYRNPTSFVDAIHEDDRARVEARLPLQRQGSYDEKYRIRRPDGTIAWIRSRAFPIRDANGDVVRVAGIAMDITAQRHLEEQLAQAQRMESIGRLAGGIAHDFNNLLTVILGIVEMLLLGVPTGATLDADLDAIKEAGERAASLTSQLLMFARRQTVAPAVLDVTNVAQQMERLLRRVLGEHIELRTVFESEGCTVIADRAQLEQVLVNLAINARDAMPSGGQLTIETRHVRVGLADSDHAFRSAEVEPGEYVLLAVSDTGVGIASDDLPHVFEPFFTTKAPGKGTGLGLATCYGIVQQAGGVILVDTVIGTGTTFTLLLPRAGERAEPVKRRSSLSIGTGAETVLFVEDDADVRRIGVQILAEQSYRVRAAANGVEALQALASHSGPVHLLVTDVIMPGMSGTELASKLRADWPGLPVLYISGYTEDSTIAQSALSPRTTFLRKPYKRETLLDMVRDLLEGN